LGKVVIVVVVVVVVVVVRLSVCQFGEVVIVVGLLLLSWLWLLW